jgi:elongation factor P--(R)-beta-lysine ligase
MLSLPELRMRAALLRLVRSFFFEQGFLEVDTPVRQPVIIPERNIVPLQSGSWFLQASPELCMKRLLAAGCEKIFQICQCFRAGERGRLHLEEFTMLEWYRTGADYYDLMADCEVFLRYIKKNFWLEFSDSKHLLSQSAFYGTAAGSLNKEWERLTVAEAFIRFSPVSLEQALETDRFEEILVEHIEPHLGIGFPVFLCDYPAQQGSLAKLKEDNREVAERFELYLAGIELANGFSELTDGHEQRQRFHSELRHINKNGRKTTGMPEHFLRALENLDRAAGIAFGLDRLLMLLLGRGTLGEAVTFAPSEL